MKFEKKVGNNTTATIQNLDETLIKIDKFVPKLDSDGVLSYNELKDKPNQDISGKLNASNGAATNLTVNGFISKGEIEIFGATPHLDFHFNNATDDYTSRIIENSEGKLNILASNGVSINNLALERKPITLTITNKVWSNSKDPSKDYSSITAFYYPYFKICTVRMYFKLSEALTAGTTANVCTIPDGYKPNARHALSAYGGNGVMNALASRDDGITIKCSANLTARTLNSAETAINTTGQSIYITGFWYVG